MPTQDSKDQDMEEAKCRAQGQYPSYSGESSITREPSFAKTPEFDMITGLSKDK